MAPMTRTWARRLALAVCALAGGCGAPLVDGGYDGAVDAGCERRPRLRGRAADGLPRSNGNRRYDLDERIAAAETRKVWIFTPAELSPELSPTGRALPAGVHNMIVPLACGAAAPAQYGEAECGVPLGPSMSSTKAAS